MTKLEIYDSLLIIKESLKVQANNHYRQSDSANDYDFGYGQACETYGKRIEALFEQVKKDVEKKAR